MVKACCGAGVACFSMSHAYTVIGIVCAALLLGLSTSGCHEGPAEKAGRSVDRAVEKTGDAVRDATRK
jgi:hypothetical protein